ncbi:MAG: hypothetical protein K5637_04655 [Lachnospiraceae bacterium]|nr:hypothetical protein [Lachnospiraceae bacterium]
MKERLTHNLRYKLLALGLAVLLWVVIFNIEDPTTTRDFTDVAVTEINADVIEQAGQAYTYVDGNTVSFRVKGRTSVINDLSDDDFECIADLSKVSVTGAVNVDISCPKYSSEVTISPIGSQTVLRVALEDRLEKSFSVQVITTGTAPAGKYISQGTATPNLVTISGPASEVNKISRVAVYVEVAENTTQDISANGNLVLLDASDNVITSSTLTLSETAVAVTVPVYNTKTVALRMEITGDPAEGYKASLLDYEPKEITIAGASSSLYSIRSLSLADYDISGAEESIEDTLVIADSLSEALPDGIYLTNKEETVAIAVDIEKIEEKSIAVPVSNITLEGISNDYTYTFTSSTVPVVFSGTADELDAVDVSDISLTGDMSGVGTGRVSITLTAVYSGPLEIEYEEETAVTVVIAQVVSEQDSTETEAEE